MLENVINHPGLDKFTSRFQKGSMIFVEGDASEDLYILISGHLDILKGDKKIAEISEPGSLFGEMSFLLGASRTATVTATDDVRAIVIPKTELTRFLVEFPDVVGSITRLLARRLDDASQILFGLKEVCDQLPDAVLLSDLEGKIISLNPAAEKLYGIDPKKISQLTVSDIYQEPEAYGRFLKQIQSNQTIKEKILKVRHPDKGVRLVSTSTTLLYDGHHTTQGVLSLGRDVTGMEELAHRYRRVWFRLVPSLLLALLVLAGAVFYGFPYFSKGVHTMDTRKTDLRNQLGKDFIMFRSLLTAHFHVDSPVSIGDTLKDFSALEDLAVLPYTGLVLLDTEKKVLAAFSFRTGKDSRESVGTSYAGIEFTGSQKSLHRVLTLYRTSPEHPMGDKHVEIAFEHKTGGSSVGWLVFQMDMDLLARDFEMDEPDLRQFVFKPKPD